MSYSDRYTDKVVAKLERKLKDLYATVANEIENTSREYFATFEERYNTEYQAYKDGKYTKTEFDNWVEAQLGRGARWDAMRREMAQKVTNANVVASSLINGQVPDVFMTNYNYSAYEIEQASGIAFNIYNESAVENLMVNEPELFPKTKVNIKKDEAWNQQRLQKELASAIIQGKDVNQIADAFQHVTDMNRNSAIRNARTCMTGAQNAGRQKNIEDVTGFARKKGFDIKKEWVSCGDNRVRDSHAHLDGVRVDPEEKFPNGLMYPGDPNGEPAEVYNCRCIMKTVFNGLDVHRTFNTKASYERWVQTKQISKSVADKPEKRITKSITADNIRGVTAASSITPDVTEKIIELLEKNNMSEMYDSVEVIQKDSNDVFITDSQKFGLWARHTLQINEGMIGGLSSEEVDLLFESAKNTVCNSMEDALIHEKNHVKLCDTVGFDRYNAMSDTEGVNGVSDTALKDQTESICEIGVMEARGEYDNLSDEAKALYEEVYPEKKK